MSTSYTVTVEQFAERHFIKGFERKYKNAWDISFRAIKEQYKRIDSLFETNVIETISDSDGIKICKAEFRVAGTKDSRKSSGNRCIVAIHKETSIVRILLVYTKTDISGRNETAEWKKLVKDNYPEYHKYCV